MNVGLSLSATLNELLFYSIRPHDYKVERKAEEVRKEKLKLSSLSWQKELVKAKHDDLMMNFQFQNSQNFQQNVWSGY